MADDDVHHLKLRARSLEELRAFLDGAAMDLGCRPVVRREGDEFVVDVYAPMRQIEQARSARSASAVTMTVVENASEAGRARQAEVGSGNRFGQRQAPRGLGIKE